LVTENGEALMIRNRVWRATTIGLSAAVVAWCLLAHGASFPSPPNPHEDRSPTAAVSRFNGSASCSGRACHGNLEPAADDGIARNEHTIWQTRDRHAEAYQVLMNEQSQRMVRNLGLNLPAHQEKSCLACHSNPRLDKESAAEAREERRVGVGCETCHGAARDWLGPHTGWSKLSLEDEKERYGKFGLTWLRSPRARAEVCVGCHVGNGDGDVNHDLIAAGHPRLEFELTAFLANMPPHWIERSKEPAREAQAWAVGQLVTARAALRLLEARAKSPDKPWPEFAEYNCFACHHDLRDRAWRRDKSHLRGRAPGSLPWNDRDFVLLPELPGRQNVVSRQLHDLMAQPLPDRTTISQKAQSGVNALDDLVRRLEDKPLRRDQIQIMIVSLTEPVGIAATNWNAAAQVYLALDALSRSGDGARGEAVEKALSAFGQLLAFPSKTDSPGNFRQDDEFDKEMNQQLLRIREALTK
jgi:hypothetical protein